MEEHETQNTALQCNTHLKGGNWVKRYCPLFAPFAYAVLWVYLQKYKNKKLL